jgi:hypothetical protein
MKLVDDARNVWKWFSVQCAAALIALTTVSEVAPQILTPYLPGPWQNRVMLILGVLVIVGRLIKQEKKDANSSGNSTSTN